MIRMCNLEGNLILNVRYSHQFIASFLFCFKTILKENVGFLKLLGFVFIIFSYWHLSKLSSSFIFRSSNFYLCVCDVMNLFVLQGSSEVSRKAY